MHVAISGLTHAYRRRTVLDAVDVDFGPGAVGLLGPNGAGKTTLLRLIAGILRPRAGTATVGGLDLRTRAGRRSLRRVLGYLPQQPGLLPGRTPRACLDYIGLLKGVDDAAARRRQVGELLERLNLALEADRRLATLSAGTLRRVGVAQALMGHPRLILLDEPTAGLDPEERVRLRSLLSGLADDHTIVVSTHILQDVGTICPDVAVLARGRMRYQGPTTELAGIAADRTFLVPAATEGAQPARVVCDRRPPGSSPAVPTLEEGYTALIADARGGSDVSGAG